jgi:hypothetical protein
LALEDASLKGHLYVTSYFRFWPQVGPEHVRFCAAAREKADIGGKLKTRAYWGLNLFDRPFLFAAEIE